MSSIRHWRPKRRRRRENDATTAARSPRQWALWSAPSVVVGYVLVVDVLAIAVLAASLTGADTTSGDWIRFAVLAAGSAVHIEAGREIERLRWSAAEGSTYVNLKAMWVFAAVLVLPLPLAIAIIALSYLHSWIRLRRSKPHRVVFSASTVVLASAAATICVATINPGAHPGYAGGLIGLIAVTVAALAYWFINYALVVGAVLLSNPDSTARKALGRLSDQFIVAGAIGLGITAAVLLVYQPWLTVTLVITILGLHRALLVGQFQFAARTDPLTGLANAVFWHEIASKELVRAERTPSPLGVLYLDLDHFKTVNDTHGHLAGDQVLKAVARELRDELRTDDLIGRLGGEEFAVLLPGTGPAETTAAAERIRRRIETVVVTVTTGRGHVPLDQLTCSIGTATYPDAGLALDDLLLAADAATYAAKRSGRNRVVAAPVSELD
ncbi:diguanylate cyclase [Kribbella albertanoniae]|uniref:GGDEF domain-containing protein n=1 Tax=Kribbella albertanoniae TaxID=1266829 RepID=A0A4R4QJ13_9ACTN|nr:GGDEF domain-containing protein [Kribbella albertanoniae]TDC35786.1 GGDEF domain-containing protein [Kribbella albertanoniae]